MRRCVMGGTLLGVLLVLAAQAAPGPPGRGDRKVPPEGGSGKAAGAAKDKGGGPPVDPESPSAVILTAKEHKALRDEIARLKRQLDRSHARAPSGALLRGKVDGNIVQLSVQFEFATEEAGQVVRLGCGLGQATGVSLDGKAARLRRPVADKINARDPAGFQVEVERPGDHQLTLELLLAVASTSATRGVTLDLPRAAYTTLDLELPGDARDVRLGGKPPADTLVRLDKNRLSGPLGPVDRLELTWQTSPSGAAAVLLAEGVITSRLEARELNTEARLTVRVQSGQVKQLRLLVPPDARLKIASEDQARVARVEPSDQKPSAQRTIHLKEATSDPLTVVISHTQPAPTPGTGKAASLGPFMVVGAARNAGSFLVCNEVPDWHPEFTPHADLTRRRVSDEEQLHEPSCVAAFRYGPGMPSERVGGAAALSWLDVEVEPVRGQIKTRSRHTLRLVPDGAAGGRWRVQTAIEVTPRWADADRLTVRLPADCTFNEEGSYPLPERVQSVRYDGATRLVTFRLTRAGAADGATGPFRGERALAPFIVRVEAACGPLIDLNEPAKASLTLPTPVDTTERDGTVTAGVPEGVELLAPEGNRSGWGGLELVGWSAQEINWRYPRRTPVAVPLAWRPHRRPVAVVTRADVTLTYGEVRIRHELNYTWTVGPTPQLALSIPPVVAAHLRAVKGARLVPQEAAAGAERTMLLEGAPGPANGLAAVLEYRYPLPTARPGAPTLLPLAVPVGVTRGEARVRLWSDPGQLPGPGPGWTEQNIEVVAERSRLPALVLHAERADLPLAVTLGQDAGLSPLIDRALVRVEVAGGGEQAYRVSYRLARLAGRHLDFELPAPGTTIRLQVRLDGREVSYELLPSDSAGMMGRLARLRLPTEPLRAGPSGPSGPSLAPHLLEIAYRLGPERLRGSALTTPLLGPRLLGKAPPVPTRWRITTPGSWVVLGPEPGPGTPYAWARRGWLLAPRGEVTAADLERWLLDADTAGEPALPPSLVLWYETGSPVNLTHVPQQVWLIVCSLGLVLVGLLLARLVQNKEGGASPVRLWLVLGAGAGAVVVAGLFVPTLVGQLAYGCQPGAAVLVGIATIQWLLRERYRRQIVFLPSFSRPTRPGSSILRPEPRPLSQPSTVDVPRSVGSSVERSA